MVGLGAGCDVELEHGLDERAANEAMAVLLQAGITVDKAPDEADGRYVLKLARRDVASATQLLREAELPRPLRRGVAEVFSRQGMFPSAAEDRIRYTAALAADLERTLELVSGVRRARVHLTLPVDDPFGSSWPPDAAGRGAAASVLIKVTPEYSLSPDDLARLLAGAVERLDPDAVHVVTDRARPLPEGPALSRLGPLEVPLGSHARLVRIATAGLALLGLLGLALVGAGLQLIRLRRRLSEPLPPPPSSTRLW